jgi:aspartate 4-decarboxylase
VADSRQVVEPHGLSLPQQIQMALFSFLFDTANSYKTLSQLIVRLYKVVEGLGHPPPRSRAFTTLNLQMAWAEAGYGADFVKFLRKHYECTDVLFRLAERSGVVLMPGGGFGGPDWSVRVSLANLPEDTYPKIGQLLREAAEGYVEEWKASSRGA